MLDAVLEDWTTAEIPQRTRAALHLLERMTLHPKQIDSEFVDGLREDGLDDPAIREAANVGFHYNLINRVADAFDFPVPEGLQKARLARMLNITGKLLRGSAADSVWVRGEGGVIRPTEVEFGRAHMLSVQGETDPALRRNVEAFVMAVWGVHRHDSHPVPRELETYLRKLALHAYRITDDELETLRAVGYTEEMLFELTIVGSMAAALVGLEILFAVLYEESN